MYKISLDHLEWMGKKQQALEYKAKRRTVGQVKER